jgi:SAM-dependent methyltransferase
MVSLNDLAVSPPVTRCKCCDGVARLCGVVDFSRSCLDQSGPRVLPYSGVPVYYHRCEQCGFIGTVAFDAWSDADFAAHIYNDDYARVDPDYLGARAAQNAEILAGNFPELAGTAILDYGAGLGHLQRELAAKGFPHVDSFDPIAGSGSRPTRRYDLVVAFEVFEHHPQPRALIDELVGYLSDDGALLFSTTLATDAALEAGLERWWYCAPRNGHISFFTPRALARLGARHQLIPASFSDGIHFFYRGEPPAWALRFSHQVWRD